MKRALLLFAAAFLGSMPVIAVVTHHDTQHGQPSFAAAVPNAHDLILYDQDGDRVAYCEREPVTAKLENCHVAPGSTFDDVMNAWLRAYEDR